MTRLRMFQAAVVPSVLAYLVWMALAFVPRSHSPELQRILSLGGYGGQPWIMDPRFYLALGVAKLAGSFGLLLFLSWGRWVFLAVTATSLVITPIAGVFVSAPLDALVGYAASLLDGAVLGLAFLSPLSEAMPRDE